MFSLLIWARVRAHTGHETSAHKKTSIPHKGFSQKCFAHISYTSFHILSARPPRGTFWCHVLALPPDRKGLSRLWVSLFGMIFHLNLVLCRVTFPVLFINSSRLLFGRAWAGSASE